jgi:hypothetical protein
MFRPLPPGPTAAVAASAPDDERPVLAATGTYSVDVVGGQVGGQVGRLATPTRAPVAVVTTPRTNGRRSTSNLFRCCSGPTCGPVTWARPLVRAPRVRAGGGWSSRHGRIRPGTADRRRILCAASSVLIQVVRQGSAELQAFARSGVSGPWGSSALLARGSALLLDHETQDETRSKQEDSAP